MATPVMMPKVGISVESCVITKWHKKKGDAVSAGDILFTYETDKSTLDEEAPAGGTVLELFFEEGDDVPCMKNVCVIGNEGEDISSYRPEGEEEPAPAAAAAPAPVAPAAAPVSSPVTAIPAAVDAQGRLKISPRAKLLAQKAGVDPSFAAATGAEGRICETDVRALIANPDAATAAKTAAPAVAGTQAAAYADIKFSGIRKSIAKSMLASLSGMAQLTNNISFDATAILKFRKALKENAESMGLANITLNDIVLFAVSRTLKSHDVLNAHMPDDSTLRVFESVNLGIAVDTERGLMVPTIMNADKKSLNEIAIEGKALARECQDGGISPDKLSGATFTVTNLGAFGIESFTPVINPPQVGILGVNTLTTKVRVKDGQIEPYQSMALSLSYDHRAVDGAPASKFLKQLCENLENFSLLLVK